MIHLCPITKFGIWWDHTQYKDQSTEKFLLSKNRKVKIAQLSRSLKRDKLFQVHFVYCNVILTNIS